MPRLAIKDFQLGNPAYRGASVTFYTVVNGAKSAVLATLYAASSGSTQLANPQKLDSYGKFRQPVYIEAPVVGTVEGLTVPTHDTGIISPAPTFQVSSVGAVQYSFDGGITWSDTGDYFFRNRGSWAAATDYQRSDYVATSSGMYIALSDHVSTSSFATDLAAGKWALFFSRDRRYNVLDYGADPTGVADSTAAFDAVLALMTGSTNSQANRQIYVPAGIYKVSDTMSAPNSGSNFSIVGDGLDSTIIQWNGVAAVPMFQFVNARHVYLDNLSLFGKSTAKPSIMVNFHRASGLTPPSGAATGQCGLRRVRIGDGTGDHTVGVKYSADGGQDTNNEQGVFEDVEIIGSATYGYHFAHSNSLLHRIVRGNVAYYGTAAICNDCSGADNAHFVADSVAFAGNAGSVIFSLARPRFPITIKDCWHENVVEDDTAVLRTIGAGWTGGGIINFMGGQFIMGDITVPGTYTVDFQATDALSVLNFFSTTVVAPATGPWRVRGNGSVVNIIGGGLSFNALEFSCEVNILHTKQGAGSPTYTNIGGGVLNVRARSKGASAKDVTPVVTALSGASTNQLDASGLTGQTVAVGLAAPDTLDEIVNGFIGQRITIFASNSNLTLAHDQGAAGNKIYLRGRSNYTMRKHETITLERWDAATGGSAWIEVERMTEAPPLTGSNVNVTQVGNVGGGTDDLITYALPANALDSDRGARGVRITAWGTTANNANAKTVTLAFGATTLVSLALTAGQLSPWRITAEVMWTSNNNQKYSAHISQGGTTKQHETAFGTATETDDNAITIKGTGAATADNDIVQHGLVVELIR